MSIKVMSKWMSWAKVFQNNTTSSVSHLGAFLLLWWIIFFMRDRSQIWGCLKYLMWICWVYYWVNIFSNLSLPVYVFRDRGWAVLPIVLLLNMLHWKPLFCWLLKFGLLFTTFGEFLRSPQRKCLFKYMSLCKFVFFVKLSKSVATSVSVFGWRT